MHLVDCLLYIFFVIILLRLLLFNRRNQNNVEQYIAKIKYCELIINRGALIFVDFVVRLNHENENPSNTIFLLSVWTTNSRIQGSMQFVETTKICVTNKRTYTVIDLCIELCLVLPIIKLFKFTKFYYC